LRFAEISKHEHKFLHMSEQDELYRPLYSHVSINACVYVRLAA
jgi:hypothetical protein